MAKRHQLPQWVIPFAFSILPLVNAGCTATPPSTATLGVVLDRMMAQVKEAEEKAIGGADLVLVQAGGEVALAVQNAKGAYASSLDKTMDAFSSADQQVINSLNSTVQQF